MSRLRRRFDPEERYGLRFTLLAFAVLLVAVPFGLLLVEVTREGPLTRVDTSAANHLRHWVGEAEWRVDVLRVVTRLGSTVWLTLLVVVGALVLRARGRVRAMVFLVATSAAGSALNLTVKYLVSRPRPSLEEPVATAVGNSFPSGHAMGSTVVYGALLVVFATRLPSVRRRWTVLGAAVLVAAIGFSRLALGVHYITDVLAGFALGLAWLAASTAVFRLWQEERLEEGEPAA